MSTVICVENVSKQYRLGQVGTGTLSDDLTRLWHRMRGKEDPFLKIGETNDRTKKADTPLDLVWALKDINFEVKEGEVLGIIGRNGAGKSTLLKILARVTTPTIGEVKVKGRIASLLEVGTGFHPDLSGRENIYLNGAILGMRKHEITRKLDEIIDFSGCDRYIDTPVKRYSSGMYVRLAFAVAAHLEPEILIVDEVLAVGDAEFQQKCLGKMKQVAGQGRTVLFVSHNLRAVEKLCNKAVVMENGCIVCDGDVASSLESYLSSETSNFTAAKMLESTENRSGAGRIRIRDIKILNEIGDSIVSLKSGGSITIQFVCENMTKSSIDGISVGYSISTSRGDTIAVHYSDYDDRTFVLAPGIAAIEARIPVLPLPSGSYPIGVRLLSKNSEEDWPMYTIGTVVVEGGDYGGNGSIPHSGRGSLLLENEWCLQETTAAYQGHTP